jgi:hypothetical protein
VTDLSLSYLNLRATVRFETNSKKRVKGLVQIEGHMDDQTPSGARRIESDAACGR